MARDRLERTIDALGKLLRVCVSHFKRKIAGRQVQRARHATRATKIVQSESGPFVSAATST